MSDFSDRVVEPLDDYGPDPFAEASQIRGEARYVSLDGGSVLLDADGNPVAELDLERPDDIAQRGATVRQLAVDERVWRFGHVIVDEAQDLTPMQWRMVVRRSQGGSVTMLGDLAQRSVGEPGEWADHLPPELATFDQQNLTTNYRSPAEINEVAATLLAELVPGLPASRAVRHSGHTPRVVEVSEMAVDLGDVVADVAAEHGVRPAVIGFDLDAVPSLDDARLLKPRRAKGLEFDAVVVVEPARFLDEPNGLSLLYVAMTRATVAVTVVHERPLPDVLATALGLAAG
ncbi:MAG: ATP-binding domain-containing protein [Actinomycetota bacterium]